MRVIGNKGREDKEEGISIMTRSLVIAKSTISVER